jgi:hypothetical protein
MLGESFPESYSGESFSSLSIDAEAFPFPFPFFGRPFLPFGFFSAFSCFYFFSTFGFSGIMYMDSSKIWVSPN